jgi:REP element-mobilizing transposase RayT
MQNKLEVLQPDTFYHIYNRANGSEKLFITDENYVFFLRKYKEYISPICHTYCYCLMPNHFHFLIQIKSEDELELYFNEKTSSSSTLQGFKTLEGLAKQNSISKLLTQQFSHLFNTYTQAFNKQNGRKGSLFMHPYKRKKINDTSYLLQLVKYIHYNPIEAKLASELYEWKFSSYSSIISKTPSLLKRDDLLNWYNDLSNFIYIHKTMPTDVDLDDLE